MGKRDLEGLESMARLFKLLLEGNALTAKRIQHELGIGHAAAKRRLDLLAGLPNVLTETVRGALTVKYATLMDARATVPMDVVAACLVSSLGTALRETSLRPYVERLRAGIASRSKEYHHAGDLDRKFWFVTRGGEPSLAEVGMSDTFLQLIDAVLLSKTISFDYVHFDGRRERVRGAALTVALHEHQFYVITQVEDTAPYPYRFARMKRLRIGKPFSYPTRGQYDPAVLFRHALGIFVSLDAPVEKVRIRLSPAWATYVETHRWHESQRHTPAPNGHVDLHLEARICPELKRWILWFGKDAEVLAPAALRAAISAELRAAADTYPRDQPRVATRRAAPPTQPHASMRRAAER